MEIKFPPSLLVEGRHGEDGLLLKWRSIGGLEDTLGVENKVVLVDTDKLEYRGVLVDLVREGAELLVFRSFFSIFKYFLAASFFSTTKVEFSFLILVRFSLRLSFLLDKIFMSFSLLFKAFEEELISFLRFSISAFRVLVKSFISLISDCFL